MKRPSQRYKDLLSKINLILSLVLFFCAPGYTAAQVRDLLAGTPESVIQKRAASQEQPKWKIPLGPALIECMEITGPDRLLVGLKKDFPGLPNLDYLMVDTRAGQVLWRYSRQKDPGEYYLFLVFSDLLLFRIEKPNSTELLALHPETGLEIWRTAFKGRDIVPLPEFSHSQVLVVSRGEKEILLTALDLKKGTVSWEQTRQVSGGLSLPLPMVYLNHIFLFYNGIEKISPEDGHILFAKPEMILVPDAPPPVIDGNFLCIVHGGNKLSAVSADKGEILWSKDIYPEIRYTNIVPLNDKIYLRGLSKSGSHLLFAFLRNNGNIIWDYSGNEPSISNLLEIDDHLFFGTPGSLIALNKHNGQIVFSQQVTTTGRSFPVHIRQIGDQVIYIGELVVASYNCKTGQLKYKHGMTPIASECHLNGLDYAIPNLKEELSNYSGGPDNTVSMMGANEMMRYQNMSRQYWSDYENAKSTGDYLSADISFNQYQINQSFAKMQATVNVAFSIMELGVALRNALNTVKVSTSIEKQELFRKSILDAYIKGESQNYVYRPNLKFISAYEQFVTICVIHLPTGKLRETYLSPQYLTYGLWNLVNFNDKVVFHHGIGLDPSSYKLSDARQYYPYNRAKTIENFLIAMPVKIPE